MANFLSKLKKSVGFGAESSVFEEAEKDYVEIDTDMADEKAHVTVRTYNIEDFADIKEILTALREGHTIALVNIKPIKEKDLIELKRSINKLKKTCDAIEGDIAGFGDDYIVCTPAFARIFRAKGEKRKKLDED
ncbi:cell division protein SepF [Candidatus Woesearchaeota archaeon]|nr:cell division protein SepF [Candidatus Woesearchaeota archaeon]